MNDTITVHVTIQAPIEKAWNAFTDPEAIKKWNAASDDWHTPRAENDLRIGGTFVYRMEAKDSSQGFDFGGTYTDVATHARIAYVMGDGRKVVTTFSETEDGTHVTTTFDPETENTRELQQSGWQAILDNFKRYVESN